jgi:hypothetical protein
MTEPQIFEQGTRPAEAPVRHPHPPRQFKKSRRPPALDRVPK